MKKILPFIISIFTAALLASSGTAAAENAALTLAPGRSYIFTNTDEDSYYYVVSKNPISQTAARYEYVNRDKSGAVESYGSLGGSFLISGGGSAHLTITGATALTVEYAAHIKVVETDDPALFTFAPADGASVSVSNKNGYIPYSATLSASSARKIPKYDCVFKDSSGNITEYLSGAESTGIDISAGGSAYLTPVDGVVLISVPSVWAGDLVFAERAEAALAYYTVAPGTTAAIKNSNGDFNYSIANDSDELPIHPKYDYVSRDAHGGVTGFETERAGDIFVPADGSATVTAVNGVPLRIWAPGEWTRSGVSVTEIADPALTYISVAPGKSVSIKNSDAYNLYSLTGNNVGGELSPRLNYVCRDASGLITDYGNESDGGAVIVPESGETVLTVTNGYTLNLCAPYDWGKFLNVSGASPALRNIILNPGESVLFENHNADMAFDLANDGSPETNTPKFDYVFKDDAGQIIEFGRADLFESFRVTGGGSALITAGRSRMLRIWFPEEWFGSSISVSRNAESAVYEYRLGAGKNAVITNNAESSAGVAANSGRQFAPKLEYALRDAEGIATACFPMDYYGMITVEGMGEASVTAGKDYDLRLTMPREWIAEERITITETQTRSVFYKTIGSGQTVRLSNISSDFYAEIPLTKTRSAAHDFVYRDAEDDIVSYGLASDPDSISAGPGGTYHITVNRGAELNLYMPYEWTDGVIEFADERQPGVYSYTLKAGESAELINSEKNYAYTVSVNSSGGANEPSFDYVYYDAENELTGYGSGDIYGELTAPETSRIVLTARRGADLKLWYPYEWMIERKVTIAKIYEPALFYATIPSGKTAEIINGSGTALNIMNNSGDGLTFPKYDYIYGTPEQAEVEIKKISGEIAAPPNARIGVRAAYGYDLRLWMPYVWLTDITFKQ